MSKAFTEIAAGIEDAKAHAKGLNSEVVEHSLDDLNVKVIRAKTGMSQQSFCAAFGFSLGALRRWEEGLRTPRGAARVLLKVVEQNPKAVIQAIG